MAPVKLGAALATLLAAVGCGDPLADADFRGEPLLALEGRVLTNGELDPERGPLRLSVFWRTQAPSQALAEAGYEQRSASAEVEFPASVEINLFEPPPRHALVGPDQKIGIGELLAYQDSNGNDRKDRDEPFAGLVSGRLVVFAPDDLSAEESPLVGDFEPGLFATMAPYYCSGIEPRTDVPPCEDIPLGVPCETDADCGDGICMLQHASVTWPDGMCVGFARPRTQEGCRPPSSRVLPRPMEANFLPACASDADCPREGYGCDGAIGACVPQGPTTLHVGPDIQIGPVCVDNITPPGRPGGGPGMGPGGDMMPERPGAGAPP